jgi:hypothetical protein
MENTSVQVIKVNDPRTNVNFKKQLAVLSGSLNTTTYQNTSSSYSQSNVTFSIVPPSMTFLDRKMYVKAQFRLLFTGPAGVGNLLSIGLNDAIRSFPWNQVVTNTNISIDGVSASFQDNQMITALAHYLSDKEKQTTFSGCGPYLDQYQSYADYAALGSARNPLALIGENSYIDPRGAADYVIETNTATAASVLITVISPVMCSPLTWGSKNELGLWNVNNVILQFKLGDLTRLWSHASTGNALTTISANFSSPPQLLYNCITPSADISMKMNNQVMLYSYYNMVPYSFYNGSLAAGSSTTMSSGTIELQNIPSKVFIYVRQRDSDLTYLTSDTFARINSISLTFNNRSSLLSNADSHTLYQMSRENGLDSSYNSWRNYQGSVLCLDIVKDLGLNNDEAPSMSGKYQISCQVNVTNTSQAAVNYSVYLIPVNPGLYVKQGNNGYLTQTLVTREQVLTAPVSENVNYSDVEGEEPFSGGNIFGKIWKGLKSVGSFVKDKVLPAARYLQPGLAAINPALGNTLDRGLSSVGAGYQYQYDPYQQSGGLMVGGIGVGGAQKTKKMSKKQLISRIM